MIYKVISAISITLLFVLGYLLYGLADLNKKLAVEVYTLKQEKEEGND